MLSQIREVNREAQGKRGQKTKNRCEKKIQKEMQQP